MLIYDDPKLVGRRFTGKRFLRAGRKIFNNHNIWMCRVKNHKM